MKNLEIKQSQRYYHFIALKGSRNLIKKDFFRDWDISESGRIELNSDCTIIHMSINSQYQYYRGEVGSSSNENNSPPYIFDVILIDYPKIDITLLGFPYKKLTIDLVNSLISSYEILSKSNFIKVDMNKLIHANDEHTDLFYKENHFFLGGVYLTISGDSFLSTVKLEGDKPLDSDSYKDYFKNRLENKECRLEKCILKCKIEETQNDFVHKIMTSINIDKFGNYKLYLQINGKNLLAIPAIFEFLDHLDCLIETPNSPILHILDEE